MWEEDVTGEASKSWVVVIDMATYQDSKICQVESAVGKTGAFCNTIVW